MIFLEKQCDTEGGGFSDEGEDHKIMVCAERLENGKIRLYEQIEGVEKGGPHFSNRQIIVDKEFIEELNKKI